MDLEWILLLFEFGDIGVNAVDVLFLRYWSKWLGNDASKNTRWLIPSGRNGWVPFGPVNERRKIKLTIIFHVISEIIVFYTFV